MKVVHVAVGVIARGDNVFITLRPAHAHQGGKWEFPGGKVEAEETVQEALCRELAEEVGITVHSSLPLTVVAHDYGDKQVKLDVHVVNDFYGEPFGKEGQQCKWLPVSQLKCSDFPSANADIISSVQRLFK